MNCSRELIDGYIDEELDAGTKAEVETHLASCPECSEVHSRMREQQAAIRSMGSYAAPANLRQSVRDAVRREAAEETEGATSAGWRWLAIAACLLLALSLGWNLSHLHPHAERELMAKNVVASHVRSLIGTHLLDVVSTDQHTVKPWFNGKLDFSPQVKDFAPQGFPLIGGRIEYLGDRTAAALVYQRRKHVINVFTWPSASDESQAGQFSHNGYNVVQWSGGGMTYWAVSDVNAGELQQFKELWTSDRR